MGQGLIDAVTLGRRYEAVARALGYDPAWLLGAMRVPEGKSDADALQAVHAELASIAKARRGRG